MTAVVKCARRALRPDGVLVVDQVEVAASYVEEEDEEVFVFWHDDGPEKARLAMRGVLLPVAPLPRHPSRHREARVEIRVTERSTSQALLVEDLTTNSNIATERSLCLKIRRERHSRIAPLDIPESDYLRGKFHDPRPKETLK